jgi:hypothetical protein
MTAAVTTLRATLATALANAGVWTVVSYPDAMPIANSVVVDIADPYLTTSNGFPDSLGPLANFRVIGYVQALDNQGNLAAIETMAVAIWNKLQTSGLNIRSTEVKVGRFDGPSGELTAAEFSLSILTTWT